jgi:hypothetical protein
MLPFGFAFVIFAAAGLCCAFVLFLRVLAAMAHN